MTTSNEQRTREYLSKFDRRKTLELLVNVERQVIFDVGSNTGDSLLEFKSIWETAVLHCFEPQLECLSDLRARAETFSNCSVILNNFAVGAKNLSDVPFYTHELTSGQSGFNKVNIRSLDSIDLNEKFSSGLSRVAYENRINHERRVDVIRLDTYMEQHGIERVHLLKIDTQGHEPEVLEGLGSRLSDVEVIITELMFYDFYERSLSFFDIEQHLIPAGFKLFDISHISKNPMNGRTDWVDVIYVNEKACRAKT